MYSTRTPSSPSRTSRKPLRVPQPALPSHPLPRARRACANPTTFPLRLTRRYADHVGIHYVLCSKLRQFPYEDIEFFLPQLCHLIISIDNESMALEEFLMDLCEESVSAALLVRPLSSSPQNKTRPHTLKSRTRRPSGYSSPIYMI
jgi:hypothetical protein